MDVLITTDDGSLFEKTIKIVFAKFFGFCKHSIFPLIFQGVMVVSILNLKSQSFLSDKILWDLLLN